jgi:hypothetical protein
MTQRTWYRRRPLYAALILVLVGAAIPVSQSLASASGTARVPVEKSGDAQAVCTFTGTNKVIGKATIAHHKDGSVSVKYSIHGAEPTRNYYLWLYSDSPFPCFNLAYGGKFKVDASGDGSKSFTASGFSAIFGEFFVIGYNNDAGHYDRSDDAHV